MIKINKKQAFQRLESLPENLKDTLFSETNAEIIRRVGTVEHLGEEKTVVLGELVGYVILGFIHVDDLAEEIKTTLNLNPGIINAIISEVDKKIFSPVRNDLKKVYQLPKEELGETTEESEAGEMPVLDLKKKMLEASFGVVDDSAGKSENKIDLSGWQGRKEERPGETKPQETISTLVEEKKAEEVKISENIPQSEGGEPVVNEEKEKVEIFQQPEPEKISFEPAVQQSRPIQSAAESGPLIIHEEVGFKPLSGKLKSLGGMFSFLRGKNGLEQKEEPVKAKLEMGGEIPEIPTPKIESSWPAEIKKEAPVVNEIPEPKNPIKEALSSVKIINFSEVPDEQIVAPQAEKIEIENKNVKPVKTENAEIPQAPPSPVQKLEKESEISPSSPESESKIETKLDNEPIIKTDAPESKDISENKTESKNDSEETIDLGMFK